MKYPGHDVKLPRKENIMFNLPKPKKKYEVRTCGLDKAFQLYEYLYIDNEWMLINLITLNLKYPEVAYYYLNECEKNQSLEPLYKEILEDKQRRKHNARL